MKNKPQNMDRRNCVVDSPGPLLDIIGLSPDNCIPGAIGAYVGCSLITGPKGWWDSVCWWHLGNRQAVRNERQKA